MIRRYLEIKDYIKEALVILNDEQMFNSSFDVVLTDLCSVLAPIEEVVVFMSKHVCNLIEAEGAVKYVLRKTK